MQVPDLTYIRIYIALWWKCRKEGRTMITQKCRRMVISWVARACELWALGRERCDQLLSGEDLEQAAKHVWRLEFLYEGLQKRYPSWGLPDSDHILKEGQRQLKTFSLPNGSNAHYSNGQSNKLQGDGTSLITMEEPSLYRYLKSMLAQAKIICQAQAGAVGGFVNLIANASHNVQWHDIKKGAKTKEVCRGVEVGELPSGELFVLIHHYADPGKDNSVWLEATRKDMELTPATFRLQILMDDSKVEGALWTRAMIDKTRLAEPDTREHPAWKLMTEAIKRVIVVDPSVSDPEKRKDPNKEPDDCGIIVASLVTVDGEQHMLVEQDFSRVCSPSQWARIIKGAADMLTQRGLKVDEVIYEKNQGGELVPETLKAYNVTLPIRGVDATISKRGRAEPVSVLYTRGKVHHMGHFPVLETQMTTWDATNPASISPGALDALVWGAHGLGLCHMPTRREVRRSGLERGVQTVS